jgi:DNA-binding NtrC family response regulator
MNATQRSTELSTVGPPADDHGWPSEGAERYLLILDAESSAVVPLPADGEIEIGRGKDAHVRVSAVAASRRHARVLLTADAARVEDLGSQNGTYLNGERLVGSRLLARGDVISIGEVALVFHRRVPRASGAALRGRTAREAVVRFDIGGREVLVVEPAMIRLFELIGRLARSQLSVLVRGETGAGKEIAAAAVHALSGRAAGRFVSLNCAAMQDNLLESELFGHERGAFSGAVTSKAGLLETASGGTVFLDEIGELSPAAQAKLLRVLETRTVLRVGDVKERAIDIRVVAATHRDLEHDVKLGRFREDLFFRLSAATVIVPPLRDRPRELPLLARKFLAEAALLLGREPLELAPAAMARLLAHRWPGNVRELRNVMEYVAATAPGRVVDAEHLPESLGGVRLHEVPALAGESAALRPIGDELRELERRRMEEALEQASGVVARAAERIGMPLRTFFTKQKLYGLPARKPTR